MHRFDRGYRCSRSSGLLTVARRAVDRWM
jgi:hypothetical protein